MPLPPGHQALYETKLRSMIRQSKWECLCRREQFIFSLTTTADNLTKEVLRRSGRAVYLYSTAHKTQLTILQLEDFIYTSLLPYFLPQPIGGFINNIFRELNATT
jgi:hypothetical protein